MQLEGGHPCYFRKGSLEGSPTCSLHLAPSALLDVDISHPYTSSLQKTISRVINIGVFFDLIEDTILERENRPAVGIRKTFS